GYIRGRRFGNSRFVGLDWRGVCAFIGRRIGCLRGRRRRLLLCIFMRSLVNIVRRRLRRFF
ncbi:MAG: hypothetical protein KJ052_19240, partial [Candidatus Hydrogenedentes bacterium]|nr:hypothetical protein [Candidatus Hydrogenedentota bacterium]